MCDFLKALSTCATIIVCHIEKMLDIFRENVAQKSLILHHKLAGSRNRLTRQDAANALCVDCFLENQDFVMGNL
jgi:hypothetical protein